MFSAGLQYSKTITMVTEICCNCGIAFGMPSDFQEQLRRDPNKWFFCPNGHTQHYTKSTEQKLREELERKKNELAQATSAKIQVEIELNKAQRKLKRVHKGTCPCCKRSFENLKRHMETKHPELLKTS